MRRTANGCTLLLMATAQRNSRLSLRTTRPQKDLIGRAAAIKQQTVSDFVLDSATEAAERTLADRTRFELSGTDWNEFVALLNRPARQLPELRQLFDKPDIFK